MTLNTVFKSTLLFFTLLLSFSCVKEKESTPVVPCEEARRNYVPTYGLNSTYFQIVDSSGKTYMHNHSGYSFSSLIVQPLCVSIQAKAATVELRHDLGVEGAFTMNFDVNEDCKTLLFKWSNGDVDTCTYNISVLPGICFGSPYVDSFVYNGVQAELDNSTGVHFYKLLKQ